MTIHNAVNYLIVDLGSNVVVFGGKFDSQIGNFTISYSIDHNPKVLISLMSQSIVTLNLSSDIIVIPFCHILLIIHKILISLHSP